MKNRISNDLNTGVILDKTKRITLALQHLIAMFGATVLVPILTGFDPSVALFSAGMGTLIFHMTTKGKVPAFLGSSFAFIPVILKVSQTHGGDLAYAQGGMFVAGLIYILLSFLVERIGVDKIKKYLAPQVIGPMIIVIGTNLIPTALNMASESYLIAGITLIVALAISLKAKGFIKQLSILIGVSVGYLISLRLGIVDFTPVTNANLIELPNFRLPKFDLGAIITIVPIIIAVFMEHLGDITTNGQVVGKNFIEDPGLNRTLLGDGLATAFAALIGGPANTTYGENTGVLAITKNYDPSILRLAAVFAIGLAFISKIGAFLTTIPSAVMGGISLMLFSMIALIGVKSLKSEEVEFNFRSILVIGAILILGSEVISQNIDKIFGLGINNFIESIKMSNLSFAAIVGILLNALLQRKRA